MSNIRKLWVFLVFAAVAPCPVPVGADAPARGETVATRKRPNWDPIGARVGGFVFFPKLRLEETYDDNIFAQKRNVRDDIVTLLGASGELRSDWNNHSVDLAAEVTARRYANNSDENHEDFIVRGNGRLDISRADRLSVDFGYDRRHEERNSPDDAGGRTPTPFDTYSAAVRYSHRFNRLRLSLDVSLRRRDFEDVATNAGATINNDDRDRTAFATGLKLSYELAPQYDVFLRGTVFRRTYDQERDDAGFERDSDGYEVVAGTAFSLTGVTTGDLFVGFMSRDFDDHEFSSVNEPLFGGSITWNVSGLTTIKGSVTRSVEETTVDSASAIVSTRLDVVVDHELLRNLILSVRGLFRHDDYDGIGREDDVYGAGISARYLLSRHVYLSGAYRFRHRDADSARGAEPGFSRNLVSLGVEVQL